MDTENNNKTILVMDKREEEIAYIMELLGYSRNASMVIACMTSESKMTSNELQNATNLRQPEVSIVMRSLDALGWIKETEQRQYSKGRPFIIYTLIPTLGEIAKLHEELASKMIQETDEKIAKLRQAC